MTESSPLGRNFRFADYSELTGLPLCNFLIADNTPATVFDDGLWPCA
jgi:hypothetical protein